MSRREILFKAKRTDNVEWVEGDLIQSQNKKYIAFGWSIDNEGEQYYNFDCALVHEVDPETVCQYTGLTDKNGTKIFDGDLVKLRTGRICKVSFRHTPEFCGFDLLPFSETEKPAPKFSVYDGLEVICNIHDN